MKKIFILLSSIVLLLASCDKEYFNPSSATEDQVINDVNGLVTLANGLQYKYSVTRLSPNYTLPTLNGLLSKELTVLNAGNTDEELLRLGGASVVGSNSVLTNVWNQSNLVKANADIILENLSIVTDQGTRGALQAHASIFKALALGNLAMFWESAPVQTEKSATFVSRAEVLDQAIAVLESAALELAKAPASAYFTSRIVSGIDYANTINALIARYALMAGNYDKAIAAADKVSLAATVKSAFNHDDASQNALYFISFSNRNVTEPVDDKFSLPTALQTPDTDKRIAFFINSVVTTPPTNKGKASFFTANNSAVPIYRGGEVTLIKAEAYARKGSPSDLTTAADELDKILMKTAVDDAWGIGANLPAFAGDRTSATEILDEIYKQRCIELYLSGMRLEDSRRFGRPQSERGRDFLPYPFSERDNNINTPADPAF